MEYAHLTDIIRDLELKLRDNISCIWLETESEGYKVKLSISLYSDGLDLNIISLPDYAELKAAGIETYMSTRHPDLEFMLPSSVDIQHEVIDLQNSGLIGRIESARFDVGDLSKQMELGYPHWQIVPFRAPKRIQNELPHLVCPNCQAIMRHAGPGCFRCKKCGAVITR